jgi:hypothetical protein
MAGEGSVKIRFRLAPADWHRVETEALWAEAVGSDGAAFVLLNSPFYAEGMSHRDVVAATFNDADGILEFGHVVARGGHSTYLIMAPRDQDGLGEWWHQLEALGCSYESAEHGKNVLFSVDVPDTSDIHAVYAVLEDGERAGIWDFQESHVGHDVKQPRRNS